MPRAARGRATPGLVDKPWREAIQRAVQRYVEGTRDRRLEKLADQLVAAGLEGDVSAMKEIGDRLDGRAHQQVAVTGENGGALQVIVKHYALDHPSK